MKKILLLIGIISMMLLVACSGEEDKPEETAPDSEETNEAVEKEKAKEEKAEEEAEKEKAEKEKTEYGLGEWWEVEDQWKLKIDSVSFTEERNQFSDDTPEAVVVIKYTYENLGYEGRSQDLFMTPDNVIDGEKKVVSTYPAGSDVSPKPTPIGAITEGAEKSYGLTSKKGDIDIIFEKYDNNSDKQTATFLISLPSE